MCVQPQLVLANDRYHELLPGCMLVLNTDMPHDVRAIEESAMLLTVHLYL
jgi:hypothetical protein